MVGPVNIEGVRQEEIYEGQRLNRESLTDGSPELIRRELNDVFIEFELFYFSLQRIREIHVRTAVRRRNYQRSARYKHSCDFVKCLLPVRNMLNDLGDEYFIEGGIIKRKFSR